MSIFDNAQHTAALSLSAPEVSALHSLIRDVELLLDRPVFTEATTEYKRRQLIEAREALRKIAHTFGPSLGIRSGIY